MKALALAIALAPVVAAADDAPAPELPAPGPAADDAPAAEPLAPTPAELAARLEVVERRAEKVEVLEYRIASLHDQLEALAPLRRFISVFVDVGWFAAGGDGAGVRADTGHRYVADYNGVPADWVLIGDPLSTTINSLGEPADLGVARAIRDDTIDSNGTPTFIVNTIGLAIGRSLGGGISISSLVEILPRTGPDLITVETARIDYRPTNKYNLVLSAGKVESVLGIEYRAHDAPDRLGITPSLLCRYLCGRPFGVRAHYDQDGIDLSVLIASGNTFQERFERDPRLASTTVPTIAAHAQYVVPIGNGIKVGVSGSFGPQDGQDALHVHQWHYGFDLRVREIRRFAFQAELVHGKQQGSTSGLAHAQSSMPAADVTEPRCNEAPCLRYKAAYGMASYRRRKLTTYTRIDWRDARHQQGLDFLYVSRVLRGTVGVQYALTSRILGKVEYTFNRELLGPQFPNDVLTTSIVVSTE